MTDMPSPTLPPRRAPAGFGGRSAALKLLGIGALTFIMIMPLVLIASLVSERRQYANEAAESVAQGWGGQQTVTGPALIVPYTIPERRNEKGEIIANATQGEAIVLAKTLATTATPVVEERERGIFRVPVYASAVTMTGSFARTNLPFLPAAAVPDWGRARLAVGIADVRGLSGGIAMTFGGQDQFTFQPGTGVNAMPNGVQTTLALGEAETPFELTFRLRGTGRLSLVPTAETFTASVASAWPHPSFDGAYLPEERQVSESGFKATWRVSHLARTLPQAWDNENMAISPSVSAFGVTFFQPVDFYSLVDRSLKYAILFVGLSFLVFFLVETVTGARVHVVQYLLAGAAQVIFYLLLLALAEQTGFTPAYLVAGSACVILTTVYAFSVLGSTKRGLAVGGALTALYALLYTLLNEEDYALLTGAVASFLALALTMFLTRKVDWYQAQGAALATVTEQDKTA